MQAADHQDNTGEEQVRYTHLTYGTAVSDGTPPFALAKSYAAVNHPPWHPSYVEA